MTVEQESDGVDVAVVGAGVVGCAVAMRLSQAGLSVVVLEALPRIAEGITSRNSGVLHSGLYNPPGWLKSQACVRGQALAYEWAARYGVWHARTGKLVVATQPAQCEELERLHANALASGARGCSLISATLAKELEPSVPAVAAIHCQQTGIIDPVEFTQSLAAVAQQHGALVLTHARVGTMARVSMGWELHTARGDLHAHAVVNAAGLYADDVAAMTGTSCPTIHPCRGDYFRLNSCVDYHHLVYPVKDKRLAGLGVHLTLSCGGGYRLGPDAEYVTAKDDFHAAEHKLETFHQAAQSLLGPLHPSQLVYDSCGIRPKLRGPDDAEERDFLFTWDGTSLVNLVGIESPGLTSALDLADRVAALLA